MKHVHPAFAVAFYVLTHVAFFLVLRFGKKERKHNRKILSQGKTPEKATEKISHTVQPDERPDFNNWTKHIFSQL